MRAYERLIAYAAYDTASDENAPEERCPSSEKQRALALALADEMKLLDITDARVDEYGYVYGTLPAVGRAQGPVIGLIAHMDTSPSASGANVRPHIVTGYDGGDILLNREHNIVMSPEKYPSLLRYAGKDLLVTDGTTLLGADDKAGIAEILTAVEELNRRGTEHAQIPIAFTPDEEIGRGADRFDVQGFGAEFAYTVDGGRLGEIEYENFNAASAVVTVHGVNIHPGEGKNRMKNAQLIAMEFNAMLPPQEIPTHTEGYEGFYHLTHMEGEEELASLRYLIRDHSRPGFEQRKLYLERVAAYLNEKHGAGTIELALKDSYYNMKEKIAPHMFLIDRAKEAMQQAGVEPEVMPIRGGTDGARLSYIGLPCPNLSTGGHNFHGRFEYIPLQSMDSMVEVLVNILKAK